MKDFRKEHLRDHAYHVSSIDFDIFNSRVYIVLVQDFRKPYITDTIEFFDVTAYRGEFDVEDFEDDCLEPLVDLLFGDVEEQVEYLINFGVGELYFKSRCDPIIKYGQ